jgi:glycine/D-amino acid oxidase-like deaminating enzyme
MGSSHDTIVIGGGFYGASIALERRKVSNGRVVLIEREPLLLDVASRVNQARVHHGYHYPRSFLTGVRSRRHYSRFVEEFADCVNTSVESYYAVARQFSKVTARQFVEFCHRIGAPVESAPPDVSGLFNPDTIEAVFRVEEASFDAARLRQRMTSALDAAGVEVHTSSTATGLSHRPGQVTVTVETSTGSQEFSAPDVFNCTYAGLNEILSAAGIAPVALKHEVAELALVDPPAALVGRAVTVMCGPFFSITPCPGMGSHVLSHVRYTPRTARVSTAGAAEVGLDLALATGAGSRVGPMIADASRFLPCMRETRWRESMWAVKTVLPLNEVDDGRPILVHRDPRVAGLVSVMGSKIDNVYDVLQVLGRPGVPEVAT